ncbi:helix-turn-helix domain-containing protein [Mycobacterium paragordonae]|jgi:transcriptional regulator with XRE-family HTH domain|uniref:helix-turn-helix domain-containing protein n=1 Tax=Mycobacterium paragordonae TaxID=1389713 RepID=UPI0012E285A5|nr:helix-turn-helix transcriptional regulator [Mycobacterium paragordonae]
MEYSAEALGIVIRERRESQDPKMTQAELGKAANYRSGASVTISRIESGQMRPGPDRLRDIARTLGMSLKQLEKEATKRTKELGGSQSNSHGEGGAGAGGERLKDRAKRIQQEIERRTTLITEAGDAFNAAHDRARDEFFMKFVGTAGNITGADQPNPSAFAENGSVGAQSDAAARIRLTSYGITHALAAGAGGAAAGAAVGGAAAYGAFVGAVSLGTASTGAAIGGLSGVAATNAALALLGGGTLAAGGAGIAGGMALLAGIVAAPALLLGVGGLVWMMKRNRKQQQELAAKLDEAEAQLAETRRGFEALVDDILPRATQTLDYIAVHAGHALKRWDDRLGPRPQDWNSMSTDARRDYQEFIDIAASQLAVVSINFESLMVSRGQDREILIGSADAILDEAQSIVKRFV